MTKQILKNYQQAIEAIADAFVKKYYGKDISVQYWTDEIGGIFVANDYYWNIDNMVDALRFKCSKERLFEWYELSLEAGMEGRPFQNLRNYSQHGLIKGKNDKF